MIEDFHKIPPYSLESGEKRALLLHELKNLFLFHYVHCEMYGNILHALGYDEENISEITNIEELPFLPVRIFKELELKSIHFQGSLKGK